MQQLVEYTIQFVSTSVDIHAACAEPWVGR